MIQRLNWPEKGLVQKGLWLSESIFSAPKKIQLADDSYKADAFYREASEGMAYIYRGDFQNAKQLLQAVQRRIDKKDEKKNEPSDLSPRDLFHRYRQAQAHRAQMLARLLINIEGDLTIKLRRAPDVRTAISEALGDELKLIDSADGFLVSLRELLGYIGAHEWRKNGVEVPALGAKIHPHYGLFSPVRGEYLDLIAQAPLPTPLTTAFDIGTGTGVIAALLARRGVKRVIATDINPRAIACASDNFSRLGVDGSIEILQQDMFPPGTADLIVCNPPWIPARPTSTLEQGVYDENSQMLKLFLAGAASHLSVHGEAWLILSDLAEHLGLRPPDEVEELIKAGGLKVISKLQTKPSHGKAFDAENLLHKARAAEVTYLWRLKRI